MRRTPDKIMIAIPEFKMCGPLVDIDHCCPRLLSQVRKESVVPSRFENAAKHVPLDEKMGCAVVMFRVCAQTVRVHDCRNKTTQSNPNMRVVGGFGLEKNPGTSPCPRGKLTHSVTLCELMMDHMGALQTTAGIL
jgi:hypothetical protein